MRFVPNGLVRRAVLLPVVCLSFQAVSSLLPFELIGLTSFNDLSRLHHLVATVIGAEPPLSRTFTGTVSKW